MSVWYIDSSKYTSITAWAASTSIAAGALRRQLTTPAVGSERVFAAIVAGTTNSTEPTWTVTKGAKNTDNTVTWQEVTGQPGVNGDLANTPNWTAVKNTAVALGQIIKDVAATTLFICTTAGTAGNGSEPSWSTTAGATTTDNTVSWTSLGAASNFSSFAAPFARLSPAYASGWGAAGDVFYIGHLHAETQSSNMALTSPGTSASPCQIICITNTSASSPALNTGGTITITGTATLLTGGGFYMYGVTISFSSTFVQWTCTSSVANTMYFDTCAIKFPGNANGASFVGPGGATSAGGFLEFYNCAFTFGQVGNTLGTLNGESRYTKCTFAATGTIPTAIFQPQSGAKIVVRDCDLSTITTALIQVGFSQYSQNDIQNCKINSSVAITNGTVSSRATHQIRVANCDSAASNYKYTETNYNGTVTQETANVRTSTGGATDGVTPQSSKAVTTANANFFFPLEIPLLPRYNVISGSLQTATIEIASNATLNDGDIWLELEYPGNAGSPMGSLVSTRTATVLTSQAAIPTSSATWAGTVTVNQKLVVTFTAQQLGLITGRVRVAKKSATVYVDPIITLS